MAINWCNDMTFRNNIFFNTSFSYLNSWLFICTTEKTEENQSMYNDDGDYWEQK